jgi:DNA-directed RNA polymerase subunit RPC12/RpoP
MAGWLVFSLRCGDCGHRWTPRSKTWQNAVVRCPVCSGRLATPKRGLWWRLVELATTVAILATLITLVVIAVSFLVERRGKPLRAGPAAERPAAR